jgi:hypothetical protein
MKTDVIDAICGGKGKEYGSPCDYYEESTRCCILLREGRITEIWENKRCISYQILDGAIKSRSKEIKKKFPELTIDEELTNDINFKKIISRIDRSVAKSPLNIPNLAVWINYLKTTASNYISGHVFPKPRCGVCKYLSELDICHLKELFINGELQENPHYGNKRKKSDKPCEQGYAPRLPEIVPLKGNGDEILPEIVPLKGNGDEIGQTGNNTKLIVEHKDSVFHFIKLLKERAEEAEAGSKKREKFMRQYSMFREFYKFLKDNPVAEKPKREFMKKHRITKNMFDRDFKEIREYVKKMIQNSE